MDRIQEIKHLENQCFNDLESVLNTRKFSTRGMLDPNNNKKTLESLFMIMANLKGYEREREKLTNNG